MPDPKKGLLSRAWDWANQGLVSGNTILRAVTPGNADWSSTDQMRREAFDPTNDISGLKRFALGASADTIDTTSSFTSPISLALFGTGALGKVTPAASRLGQVVRGLETVAGGGMAAQGGVEVGQNAGDMLQNGVTPDNVRGVLGGLGTMAGGYAGMQGGLDSLFPEPAPGPRLDNVTSIENSRHFVRSGTPEVFLSPAEKGLLNQNVTPKQRGPQLVTPPKPTIEITRGVPGALDDRLLRDPDTGGLELVPDPVRILFADEPSVSPGVSKVRSTVSPADYLRRVGADLSSVIRSPKDLATIEYFRKQIQEGKAFETPQIHLDEMGNIIGADGRHRALAHFLEKTERMPVEIHRQSPTNSQ